MNPERSPLWIVDLVYATWDEDEGRQARDGRPIAKARLAKNEDLDEFAWTGREISRLANGHQILQVVKTGKRTFVRPLGTVISKQPWTSARNAQHAIVFLARPEGRRSVALQRAQTRLGAHGKALKGRGIRLVRDSARANAIRQLWRPR